MDATVRRRKIQKLVTDSGADIHLHDVTMFTDYPQYSISLWEFEELALERLQLLRILEQASLKGYKSYTEEWKTSIKDDLAKNGLKKYKRLLMGFTTSQNDLDVQARRADHLSHYILRLAYCRSEDLRKWFVSRELEWFKLKFLVQSPDSIKQFLQINKFTYVPISSEDKDDLKNDLIISTPGLTDVTCDTNDFYKVPFTEVVPLVKSRRIFLKQGYAYILMSDLVVCIQSRFRASLSESLNIYNRRLPSLDDDRLNNLLSNLHNIYTGKTYVPEAGKESINPADIDVLAKNHFPWCMKHIHSILRSTHHLKHKCRLQYGLFLKAIGLSFEDAMDFFRQEFTKTMDVDKYEKGGYSYNIRHQYGKAGKLVDYSPYSCYKIIIDNVGPGEHHGCPFKHWDISIVKQKLTEIGMGSEDVSTITELINNGHYQIACTKYFESRHSQPPSDVISHPNQYFTESVNLVKEKQQKIVKSQIS